jgi:flagellar FliJ protein
MAKPDSFAMLQQLAEQRRDGWTRRLGTLLAQIDEARGRLQLLVDYRSDYQGRLERAARGGIRGEGLRNYQSFLANLETAIEQQTTVMGGLARQEQQLRGAIAGEQRQIESFVVLQRRRARVENVRENRRAQAQQDEFAINSVMRVAANRERGGAD